jgi:hypothetical protein
MTAQNTGKNNWHFIIIRFDWVKPRLIKVIHSYLLGVEIDQSAKRRAKSWTLVVRFPARAKNRSLLHNIYTCSETNPTSYPLGTDGSFGGEKAGA